MGGIGTLYDELLPIYCSEDLADGGLGMSSGQIGQILMVCGCALMIFQMFGYSRLSKALGPLRLLYLSCWGHVLMMLLPAFGVLVRGCYLYLLSDLLSDLAFEMQCIPGCSRRSKALNIKPQP